MCVCVCVSIKISLSTLTRLSRKMHTTWEQIQLSQSGLLIAAPRTRDAAPKLSLCLSCVSESECRMNRLVRCDHTVRKAGIQGRQRERRAGLAPGSKSFCGNRVGYWYSVSLVRACVPCMVLRTVVNPRVNGVKTEGCEAECAHVQVGVAPPAQLR